MVWGLCIMAGLVVSAAVAAWWVMIRMPGASYHGGLPAPDGFLRSLAAELHRDLQHLAVEIGERNVLNRPNQLATAADYIESKFQEAGYEARRQE